MPSVERVTSVVNALRVRSVDSKNIGKKTITLDNGHKVIIKGGSQTHYDAEAIMQGLREAGMPENHGNL